MAGDFNINLLSKNKVMVKYSKILKHHNLNMSRSGTKLNDHISLKLTAQNMLRFDEIGNLNTPLRRC